MALFYFLIPDLASSEREAEIFLIYPGRDLALSSSQISDLRAASFYPAERGAASQRVSDHCFIGEI